MVSSRIAWLRKSVGLSQAQLAEELHISASAEGMYEQGRRTPSLDILVEMARLFDVSLDYLITGSEHTYSADGTQGNVLQAHQCSCKCCCRYHHRCPKRNGL